MVDRVLSHQPRTRTRGDRLSAADDRHRLQEENAELLYRIIQLRTALQSLTHDNAELRRTLAQLKLENRNLRDAARLPVTKANREAHLHAMLRDPGCMNP